MTTYTRSKGVGRKHRTIPAYTRRDGTRVPQHTRRKNTTLRSRRKVKRA